jgi:hypothetical protein
MVVGLKPEENSVGSIGRSIIDTNKLGLKIGAGENVKNFFLITRNVSLFIEAGKNNA